MNPWRELKQALSFIKHLEAENARLKRQMDTVMKAFKAQENSIDVIVLCPGAAGLDVDNSRCNGDCYKCWKQALEEVE